MRKAATIVLALVFTLLGPAAHALEPDDIKNLAGKWDGFATGGTFRGNNPIQMTIDPDGSFSISGRTVGTGKLSVVDGKGVFTAQGPNGDGDGPWTVSTKGGKQALSFQGKSARFGTNFTWELSKN